jgi:enoyl-[acyl-carrier protein] reductase III
MNWALILGGSSGFGLATAQLMAGKGYNLFIIHRDRKVHMSPVDEAFEQIRKEGIELVGMNINANDNQNHSEIIGKLKEALGEKGKIRLFLHSIADGNVKPIINTTETEPPRRFLGEDDFIHTIHAMGISFPVWSKLLFENGLFANPARIIGLTSEGSQKVLAGYAAVAASKSVLESSCRYLAAELAPFGITTNLINAGITETAALRAIPGAEKLLEKARQKNPFHRITRPEDVANVIYLLSTDEAAWINGEIIRVDGGEQLMT